MGYMRDRSGNRLDALDVQRHFQQRGGWSVISTNPASLRLRTGSGQSNYNISTRSECVPPLSISAVKLVYANWYNGASGETPNNNVIRVRAAIAPQGPSGLTNLLTDPKYKVHFGGRSHAVIGRGDWIESDPIYLANAAGRRFFIDNTVDCVMPLAPAAPTVGTAVGALAVGTYGVAITIIYPDGVESACSPCASQAVSGSQNIVVTAPTAVAGAVGYRVWMTLTGGSQVGLLYDTQLGIVPFNVNASLGSHALSTVNLTETIERADPTGAMQIPMTWGGTLGGTTPGTSNNGEANALNWDLITAGNAFSSVGSGLSSGVAAANGGPYMPVAVLGLSATQVMRSAGLIGDSIMQARADAGFGSQMGGWGKRLVMGQTASRAYNASVAPTMGHTWMPQSSEQGSMFASVSSAVAGALTGAGFKRTQITSLNTSILDNYGTNDLGVGPVGSAVLAGTLTTVAGRFTGQGKTYIHADILPVTNSTDGWNTVANQTFTSNSREGYRRAINNWLADTTGQAAVTSELPFIGSAGSAGPSYNPYGTADGTSTIYITAYPFVQGSEVVKVNGVTKVVTTDYTYTQPQTINGIAYASGVTFNSPPAGTSIVAISYTKIAGFSGANGICGSLAKYLPISAAIEVNAAGAAALNGGWWKPAAAPAQAAHTLTATFVNAIQDSSQAWTQDQWRGYCIQIVTDTTTPAAVGQVRCILYNTATQINILNNFTTQPSVAATYKILDVYTEDGLHPSTAGHMLLAAQGANNLALVV